MVILIIWGFFEKLLRHFKISIYFIIDRFLRSSCSFHQDSLFCSFVPTWTPVELWYHHSFPRWVLYLSNSTSPTRGAAITDYQYNGQNGLSVYISTKRLHWTAWKHSSINQSINQSIPCPFHLTEKTHTQHSTTGSSTKDVSCDAVWCVVMAMLRLDVAVVFLSLSSGHCCPISGVLLWTDDPQRSQRELQHSLHHRGSWEMDFSEVDSSVR